MLDFVAYDPDGFLDTYTLYTLYGLDESMDLLSVAGLTLTPSPLNSGLAGSGGGADGAELWQRVGRGCNLTRVERRRDSADRAGYFGVPD